MNTRTGFKSQNTGVGFTLVELLLAVVIVLLMLGAVIFNFSRLQRGAGLDEGANQVEALIRFARAQSAHSGRQVQLVIQPGADSGLGQATPPLSLQWEPDPINRPGLFEPLPEAAEFLRGIGELVRFDRVRLGDEINVEKNPTDSLSTPEAPSENSSSASAQFRVGFYPDGSSDSAEIMLASRSEDDHRRLGIQLIGVTGSIRRQRVDQELPNSAGEPTNPPAFAENAITSNPTRGSASGR